MEERFRHFDCLCLPGFKAQTDPDFLFAILVGDAMPAHWIERLAALIAGFPQSVILSRPPGPHRKACQNDHNDSRQGKPVPLPRLDTAGEAELKASFAIDADQVLRVFA